MRSTLALLAGCVPHLYSEGADSGPTEWAPVENTWKQCGTPSLSFYDEPTGYDVGERFPDARLVDQNGDTVSMWQFTGCVTILDLSTGWCAPCQQLAQHVDELYAPYEKKEVMYVTLLSEGAQTVADLEDVQAWSKGFGVVKTPVLVDRPEVEGARSHSAEITDRFPRIVSIDREMRIANDDVDAEETVIEAEIERLLAE